MEDSVENISLLSSQSSTPDLSSVVCVEISVTTNSIELTLTDGGSRSYVYTYKYDIEDTWPVQFAEVLPRVQSLKIENRAVRRVVVTESSIMRLPALCELELSGSVIIENIASLSSLNTISLIDTSVDWLNECTLDKLVSLSLSKCRSQLYRPIDLNGFTRLTTLRISDSDIGYLPDIDKCTDLVTISVHNSNLSKDSVEEWDLGQLTKLKRLEIVDSRVCGAVDCMGEWIGRLSSLTHLDMSGNRITGTIPSTIQQLSKLKCLDLHNNRISRGLESIQNLPELELVDLNLNNSIPGAIPATLFTTNPNLTRLYIQYNWVVSLPDVSNSNLAVIAAIGLQYNTEHWMVTREDDNIAIYTNLG